MSLPYLFTSRRSVGILVARLLILEQFGDSPVVVQVDPRHKPEPPSVGSDSVSVTTP